MVDENETQEVFDFPCRMKIKAFGNAGEGFAAHVLDLVRQELPDTGDQALSQRNSRNGKYQSISVDVMIADRPQMERIYRLLHEDDQILTSL